MCLSKTSEIAELDVSRSAVAARPRLRQTKPSQGRRVRVLVFPNLLSFVS